MSSFFIVGIAFRYIVFGQARSTTCIESPEKKELFMSYPSLTTRHRGRVVAFLAVAVVVRLAAVVALRAVPVARAILSSSAPW